MKKGTWVKSFSKGTWQVVGTIADHYQARYSLDAPKKLAEGPFYSLKRIVDDKGKKAFAAEVAQGSFVRPLSKTDDAKLQKILQISPELPREFEAFEKPVDALWNLRFALTKKSQLPAFKREMAGLFQQQLSSGLTGDDVLRAIAGSPYVACLNQIPVTVTLQFVCPGYEVRKRELVYYDLKVMDF